MHYVDLLIFLVVAHFLCDYPLQGDFLARAKNHMNPIPGVPWRQALTAHAGIHAGAVFFITGWYSLALFEFAHHWYTDYLKSDGRINYNQDQVSHLLVKFLYVYLMVMLP